MGTYRVFNIGHSEPVALMDFIQTLEKTLQRTATKTLLPMAPGDVAATYADVSALAQWTGVNPHTGIEEGIARFADWYQSYFKG